MLGRPWTSCAGSDAVRSRTISSRISPASSVCPALIAARHAYVAANRSKRFCQPPNRPPARSATSSCRQRAASKRGCGFGAVCTTMLRPVELGRREVECQRQEEALRGRPITRELAHHVFVQHALVSRVLIDDGDAGVGLEEDVRVEDLEKRRCLVSGVRCQVPAGKELEGRSREHRGVRSKSDT